MNMCEALRLGRKENRAIKLSGWPDEVYVYHGMDNLLRIIGDGSGDRELTLSVALLMYDDWELSTAYYHGLLETPSEKTEKENEVELSEITSVSQLPGYKRIGHGDEWARYVIDGVEYFDTSCGCAGIYSEGKYVCRTEKELIGIILERRAQLAKKEKAANSGITSGITSVQQLPSYELVMTFVEHSKFRLTSPKLPQPAFTYTRIVLPDGVYVYADGDYDRKIPEHEFIAVIMSQLNEETKT